MRLTTLFPIISCLGALNLVAGLPLAEADSWEQRHPSGMLEAWLMPGLATGKLDWNIAAPDGSPDVLSELIFDNIRTLNLDAGIKYRFSQPFWRNVLVQLAGRTGAIRGGTEHDRDWLDDDRTQLFSYSRAHIENQSMNRIQAAFGYAWPWTEHLTLEALAGYEWNRQKLRITRGRLIFPTTSEELGYNPLANLDNRFEATWQSGWLGLGANLRLVTRHQVGAALQYHHLHYEGEATWNLRRDFAQPDSFEQEARGGHGLRLQLQYRYDLLPTIQLALAGAWERFEADDGRDWVNLVQPQVVTVESRLNDVNWQQYSLNLGLAWRF